MLLGRFAKHFGFKTARDKYFARILKRLQKNGAVEIVQGGFIGDSMHHPKRVHIRDPVEVALAFGVRSYRQDDEIEHKISVVHQTCGFNGSCILKIFLKKEQKWVCCFDSTCNQQRGYT